MDAAEILDQVITLAEAVMLADQLGHPLDRNNLARYATQGRLAARKSAGTWLTTRSSVRELIIALETQKRGRPHKPHLPKRAIRRLHTSGLLAALISIQRVRTRLRDMTLSDQEEARLWGELATLFRAHADCLPSVPPFEEAQAVIERYNSPSCSPG